MEIILGIIVVVLLVIVAVLVVIANALRQRNKQYEDGIEVVINKTIEDAFKREKKKIAKMYAEEERVAEWLEQLSQEKSLDSTKLATETEKRAYALALKKAEDAVTQAEMGLESVRQEIRQNQKDAAIRVKQPNLHEESKNALHRLYKQEKTAEKRVKSARKRLTLLTDDVSSSNLDDIFQNLEAAPPMVPSALSTTGDPVVLPVEIEPTLDGDLPLAAGLDPNPAMSPQSASSDL